MYLLFVMNEELWLEVLLKNIKSENEWKIINEI